MSVRLTQQALHYCHIPFPLCESLWRGDFPVSLQHYRNLLKLSLSSCTVEDVALLEEIRNVKGAIVPRGDTHGTSGGYQGMECIASFGCTTGSWRDSCGWVGKEIPKELKNVIQKLIWNAFYLSPLFVSNNW